MSWKTVGKLPEIRDGEIYPASVQGVDVVILRFAGGVAAYLDACPHEGAPLRLGEREGDVLVCYKHLWEFDVRSGEHISRVPRAERNLKRVPVRVVGDEVEVDVSGFA